MISLTMFWYSRERKREGERCSFPARMPRREWLLWKINMSSLLVQPDRRHWRETRRRAMLSEEATWIVTTSCIYRWGGRELGVDTV